MKLISPKLTWNMICSVTAVFLLLFAYSPESLAQATINPGGTPNDTRIVERLTGTGLDITNPMLEQGIRNTQIATFTNGIAGAGLGFDEGVLFSTGNAVNDLTTRNVRAVTSVSPTNTGTDPNLIAINPSAAFNTVAYSFDITLAPGVTGIRIVFQFGSEEYPDYVGSVFNDLFGFFVSGPGIGDGVTMKNFAKLPSNGDVIAVNSVNGGVVGDQGDANYEGLNLNQTEFYIINGHRNDGGPNTNPQPGPFPVHIEYNGITRAITRDIGGLVGGETYRFKVAIADVGDGSYDSGVLLHQIIGLRETDLSIEKTVSNPTPIFGEVVTFNLKATNKDVQQPDSVFQVQATDLLPSGYTFISAIPSQGTYNPTTGLWDIGAMAVGGEEELVIQARVNPTGDYRNLVNIQANDAVDIDQTDNYDEASVTPVPPDPGLSFAKTGVLSADGNTVTYTFTVTNIGNMTMTGVAVTDPKITDPIILGTTTLAPNESTTGTATYTVTQAEKDAGVVENLATVTGTPPFDPADPEEPGQPITPVPSTPDPSNPGTPGSPGTPTEVDVPADPSLSLVKTGVLSADGNTIEYTFTVTNTGNVTLDKVEVDDPKITDPIALDATTLAPGETATGTATYTVTQAEKDAGTVENMAGATGTPPGSTDPIPPAESVPGDPANPSDPLDPGNTPGTPTEVVVPADPSLSLVKTGVLSSDGNTVEYTFTVTNTGNVTLTGVAVEDSETDFSGTGDDLTIVFDASRSDNAEGTLAPGEVAVYTATYVLTQADKDAGGVDNLATATGTPPTTDPNDPATPITPVPSTPDPSNPGTPGNPGVPTEVDIPADPALSLVKTGALSADGNTVEYTFTVTNTGNVTLTGVTVEDSDAGFTGTGDPLSLVFDAGNSDNVAGTLAPGEVAVYTAVYLLTQEDKDAGGVSNVAVAGGTPPGSTDPIPPTESVPGDPANPSDPLDTGNTPGTPTEVVVPADPSLSLVKTGVLSSDGNTVDYTFTVTNTGNVTIDNIELNDPKITAPITLSATTLAPGQSVTGMATYTVTQAEKDAGTVANVAEVTGTPPGSTVPIPPTESVPGDPNNPSDPLDPDNTPGTPTEVDVPADPSLSLVKTGTLSSDGNTVVYTFTVTNTGNVTMNGITIAENDFSGTGTAPVPAFVSNSGTSAEGTLAPSEVATYTASYTLTQADKDAGVVENLATTTGTPPFDPANPEEPGQPITPVLSTPDPGNPGTPGDSGVPTEVVVPADPSLSLVKTGVLSADGNTVEYTFTVTNTGNVTIDGISVADAKITSPITLNATTLAPGVTATGAASYVISQLEKDAGSVENVAEVTGTPPGSTVSIPPAESVPGDPANPSQPLDPSNTPGTPTEVVVPAKPTLSFVKTGVLSADGNTVEYTFTVTNTGNVTIDGISVSDPKITSPISLNATTLAPGQSATGAASYVISQLEKDAGSVVNVAEVTGTPPGSAVPIPPAESVPGDPANPSQPLDPSNTPGTPTEVVVPANPSLILLKGVALTNDLNGNNKADLGDELTYMFTIVNDGNVTLRQVEIRDTDLDGLGAIFYDWPGEDGVLIPGQRATATARYMVTAADVLKGSISNTAVVNAKRPMDPNDPTAPVDIPETPFRPEDPNNPGEPDPDGNPGDPTEIVTGLPEIEAHDDDFGPVNGRGGTSHAGHVLEDNGYDADQYNGSAATMEVVEIEVVIPAAPKEGQGGGSVPVLDPLTGVVAVPAGTAAGAYEIVYRIIDLLSPDNSSTATIRILVVLPPTVADAVGMTTPGTSVSIPIVEVLSPGTDGSPSITFPDTPAGFDARIDEDGTIRITPGPEAPLDIPVGVPFEVRDTYGNTVRGTITVTVQYLPIIAASDEVNEIEAYGWGAINVLNVLDNDLLGGIPASLATVRLTRIGGDAALTLNADGSVDVRAGTSPGTYTLSYRICELAQPNNCADASVQVTVVAAGLRIPNFFSPNGDGINDYYQIEGIEGFDRMEFTVFNRWGNQVYRHTNYRNDWNGGNLNEGTYFYQIRTYRSGEIRDYKGWIMIKR